MDKVRIGLVGVDGFARIHLGSIDNCIDAGIASLDAVTVRLEDRGTENFKMVEQRDIRIYSDVFEMLEQEQGKLDLIALPTGIDSHALFSAAALRKGYHVMCEKPAAGTMEDVRSMLDAQRETGRILAIGFQNIYTPSLQKIKQIRLDGTLGELREARTRVSWPRDSRYYSRNSWAGKLRMNGKLILDSPLQNATAHFLQNMLYAAGKTLHGAGVPKVVYGENYHAQPIESADTQYIRIETEEGPVLKMSSTHATNEFSEPIADYLFEKGRIHWAPGECEIMRYEGEKEVLVEKIDNSDMELHHRVFWNVCRDILAGKTPASTIENSWQQVLCINTLFEAAEVQEIGEEHCEIEKKNGQEERINYYVPHIVKLQKKMFEKGIGFAEAGVPWGKRGSEIKVSFNKE